MQGLLLESGRGTSGYGCYSVGSSSSAGCCSQHWWLLWLVGEAAHTASVSRMGVGCAQLLLLKWKQTAHVVSIPWMVAGCMLLLFLGWGGLLVRLLILGQG